MRHHLRATYTHCAGRTGAWSVYETGSFRLRHSRGSVCEAVIVNTGGGLVGGDHLKIMVDAAEAADLVVSSVAAEKVYRSDAEASEIAAVLTVGAAARLAWLPQETILFDRARLARRFAVDLAADARFIACEIVQFGRVASGEHATHGQLRDSWRIRRAGHLIHADESAIDGALGATLDRGAVGAGARAVAQLLCVAPGSDHISERLEGVLAPFRTPMLDGGVSAKDAIVVARLLGRSSNDLRPCLAALVEACPGFRLPRGWR